MLPFHQRRVVALAERVVQCWIFDGPAIEKNDLLLARRAADARPADEAAHTHARDLRIRHFQQFADKRGAEKIAQPLTECLPWRQLMHEAFVDEKNEPD